MKRLFFLIILFRTGTASEAQMVIQPGAQFKTTLDAQLTFDNITVTNNDASSDFSLAIVTCKGGTNTLLNGTGKWVIRKLVIDKKTGELDLGAAVQVTKQLQMVSGQLDLNGRTLTLSSGATLEGENETTRVRGTSGVIQTTVPLNAPASSNPGKLGAVISSSQNLGMVTVKRWHNPASGESKIQRFYQIMPTNNTGLNATVRFYYLNAELNGLPEAGVTIFTRSTAQNTWTKLGYTRKDASLNYMEKTVMNTLQQYGFGSSTTLTPLTTNALQTPGSKKGLRMQLAPVPAIMTCIVTIHADGAFKSNLKVYGADGRLYQQKPAHIEAGRNQFVIDVSRLTSGTYYVQIDLPDGAKQTLPLMKQ